MKANTEAYAKSKRHSLPFDSLASLLSICLFTLSSLSAQTIAGPDQTRTEGAVRVQMHNVMYHYQDDVAVHIRQLGGLLIPTKAGQMPIFDDKGSFTLEIAAAELAMKPQALANALNRNVLAGSDAPIKDLSLFVEKDRLKIKGKLHSEGDIGFEAEGHLSAAGDGNIRLHLEKVKALHLPVKGLMDLFGVKIADLIKAGKVRGVSAEKDDLILDPKQILPPPRIAGKITEIRLERDNIVQVFGNPANYKWMRVPAQNYMAYRGNHLQFGKLVMNDADMVLIDQDPRDPFDFYLDHYQEQLTAGYTKITKEFGLRVFFVDFNKLNRAHTASRGAANNTAGK